MKTDLVLGVEKNIEKIGSDLRLSVLSRHFYVHVPYICLIQQLNRVQIDGELVNVDNTTDKSSLKN